MSVREMTGEEILGGNSIVAFATPGIVAGPRKLKVKRARGFAVESHGDQRYGQAPYAEHLATVVSILEECGFSGNHLAAGWLHDVVEDTDKTVDDLRVEFGEHVAQLVWAVTGGGEREAHVATIYEKITAYPDAAVIKLADRIANIEAAQPGDRHSTRYASEHADFAIVIEPHVPTEMWHRYLAALKDSEAKD